MTAPDSPTGSDDRHGGRQQAPSGEDEGRTRLRFPGGRLRPSDWAALAGLAGEHAGELHLLPRGAVRIPGMDDRVRFGQWSAASGLPASAAGEGSRCILASPLAGRLPGRADLGDLPERLGAALTAHEDLAVLHESFLFGLDDGSGDVLEHGPDLAAVAGAGRVRLHVGGRDCGLETSIADTVTVLADAATSLVRSAHADQRLPPSGRVHDLVVVALSDHPRTTRTATTPAGPPTTSVETPSVGWIDTVDGLVTLLAVVPGGVVPARLAEFLGAIERPSTISADRVIGLHGLTEVMAEQVVRVLAPMGLVFDAASPWVEAVTSPGSA